MHDVTGLIGTLRRPNLLVRAARFGVDDYRRSLHLPRLLNMITLPRSAEAILKLFDIEAGLNQSRLARTADYSVGRHVEVLIALLGEARLIRASTRPPGVAPHGTTMLRPVDEARSRIGAPTLAAAT